MLHHRGWSSACLYSVKAQWKARNGFSSFFWKLNIRTLTLCFIRVFDVRMTNQWPWCFKQSGRLDSESSYSNFSKPTLDLLTSWKNTLSALGQQWGGHGWFPSPSEKLGADRKATHKKSGGELMGLEDPPGGDDNNLVYWWKLGGGGPGRLFWMPVGIRGNEWSIQPRIPRTMMTCSLVCSFPSSLAYWHNWVWIWLMTL